VNNASINVVTDVSFVQRLLEITAT